MRSDEPPSYKRTLRGSGVDAYEPAIRRLLAEFPRIPATVIAERIGWKGGRTVFCERVPSCDLSTCRPTPASAPRPHDLDSRNASMSGRGASDRSCA